MTLSFDAWWRELRTEEDYADMGKREIARRAWDFSRRQEQLRCADLAQGASDDPNSVSAFIAREIMGGGRK